jgi:hypothetical protein
MPSGNSIYNSVWGDVDILSRMCFETPMARCRIFEAGEEEFLRMKDAGELGNGNPYTIDLLIDMLTPF